MSGQLPLLDVDSALEQLADRRADDCRTSGLPTTVDACIAHLCRNTGSGTPSRSWEVMTPSRYVHAADLLRAGVASALVTEAIARINASAWPKKPVCDVTRDDFARAAEVARWASSGA